MHIKAALLLAALTSCTNTTLVGNGTPGLDNRPVPELDSLSVSEDFHAVVSIGPRTSLTLSGDDNLLPHVVTEVIGKRLVVRLPDHTSFETSIPTRVELTVPSLVAVDASGAATVDGTVAPTSRFDVAASGAAEIHLRGIDSATTVAASGEAIVELRGRSTSTHVDASGDAAVHNQALDAADLVVGASGNAAVEAQANLTISATVSGNSLVQVWGNPPARDLFTSGNASIRFR